MKPEDNSVRLLSITRSKAKMVEYEVPLEHHLSLTKDPARLFSLTIGILGDYGRISSNEERQEYLTENSKNIIFSAQFLDSYCESKLNSELSDYFLLVGSASYYLADMPGNARVLISRMKNDFDFQCQDLEQVLFWILRNKPKEDVFIEEDSVFFYTANEIIGQLKTFHENGSDASEISEKLDNLCSIAYATGTDRELLIADLIKSITKKQIFNSTWSSLRRYSDVNLKEWTEIIQKPSFIKEFWPAQKKLGEKNIYRGQSAVIQMPTSAGKTKSTEIIIRSSFLSRRSRMAVIIAPFRALCSEIKNNLQEAFLNENVQIDEPTDVFQSDFLSVQDFNFEVSNLVLVLTPEKFMYMLRSSPEIASEIGTLIYDEGHQFDNGIRGVTYELLLSTLKSLVGLHTQIILISAVISNAKSIGNWLIKGEKEIITGTDLSPTFRSLAFVSWTTILGRLEFVNPNNLKISEFFVPRILEQENLNLKKRELKKRVFPEKGDGKQIALYLGLKLIKNGSIAIFCGSKDTVNSICKQLVELNFRNYNINAPLENSNTAEVNKLAVLHELHFGSEFTTTQSAKFGVFAHSSSTPHGLRLAIEHSMQTEKIKFVVCTSTLAQGVNLPIKYLLITSFYQAGQKIKTRDFHNLIGRVGRSGIHTEGSVIFTDTELYDKRRTLRHNWKWREAVKILDHMNTEPCGSTLLSIFDDLKSSDGKESLDFDLLNFAENYLNNPKWIRELSIKISEENMEFEMNDTFRKLSYKVNIISAIESYLMAHWSDFNLESNSNNFSSIAKETLAYELADKDEKENILQLFTLLGNNIKQKIPKLEQKIAYSKSLMGVQDLLDMEVWLSSNSPFIKNITSHEELLDVIWPLLYRKTRNANLIKIIPPELSVLIIQDWIKGLTYFEILDHLQKKGAKISWGTKERNLNQIQIIDICDGGFSYETTLIISALVEIIKLSQDFTEEEKKSLTQSLNELQKRIKYGLESFISISFFEVGFSDRVISSELASSFPEFPPNNSDLKKLIKDREKDIREVLEKYPDYFTTVLEGVINS